MFVILRLTKGVFMRLNENRNWFVCLILTVITFGIYELYLLHVMARETNISCKEDNKHTMGLLLLILLSLLTCGIWSIVWMCLIISRWEEKARRCGEHPSCSILAYLLWSILGSLIIIGPLIAFILMMKGFNQANRLYNNKLA